MMVKVKILTKPGCCLCETAKSTIKKVQRDLNFVFEEIDISKDEALEKRFGQEIPVIFINDKKAFKYKVDEKDLRHKLLWHLRAQK